MPIRYDAHRLQKARRTPQGYVRVDARLGRIGVQSYRQPDGTVRRELRHPDDVLSAPALARADVGTPVTIGHPGLLTPENTAEHRVGSQVSTARADGRFTAAELQLDTAEAIARVDSGELSEISSGYTIELDETPGVWEGQRYDARQTQITLNHIAPLPRGHGGAGTEVGLRLDAADAVYCEDTEDDEEKMALMKIRLDGVETEVPEVAGKEIESLRGKLAAAEKAQGAAEGKATDLQKRLDAAVDPKAMDARVDERVQLVAAAQRVLGNEYSVTGKTARQVHEDVLKQVRADSKYEGRSDEFVAGAFENAISGSAGSGRAPTATELAILGGKTGAGTRQDADDREDADDVYDTEAAYAASIAAKSGKKPATK
jgi:hypothetical protein